MTPAELKALIDNLYFCNPGTGPTMPETHAAIDELAADLTAAREMIAALEHERDVARDEMARQRDVNRELLARIAALEHEHERDVARRERDEALSLAHAANELMAMRGNQVGK